MDQDPPPPSDRPKPPPPSLSKPPASPPPPSSSAPSSPPPSSEPALKVSVAKGSTEHDKAPDAAAMRREDRPGADAGMPNRVVAAFLDGLIAGGIVLGVALAMPWFLDFLGTLVGMAYLLTRDALPFLGGQSIGKKAMGIRAVTMDGKSLAGNWQPGIIRNVALLIPFFGLVELVILITRQDRPPPLLRLGDEWAKTKVIIAGGPVEAKGEGGAEA